jgi:hypothetical protein
MRKRLWAMTLAIMIGGGLAAAVGTPAMAVNNFIYHYNTLRGPGTEYLPCVHGQNYDVSSSVAASASYTNNCDVRVWVYDNGVNNPQCVSPKKSAAANFSDATRVWISQNSAAC